MKDTIWIKKGRFTPLAVVLMFAFPLVTALICLCFGRMSVPIGEVLSALRTALTGGSTSNVQNYSIVINLRLPRILMAIIVGAGLSCAGNTYQSLFSNPLATPDILGVTSGTCVGAILAIILSCSILETQLIALVFGLICNGVQREHNKKLNNGLPILHKVPPKRDYGRYFCIMAEKGGTSHGGLTEKLSPFFHAKKQEVNAYGR